MSDMADTIAAKSDQLNADDMIGKPPMTITITGAKVVKGSDQPAALSYQGDGGKPYKPCKSMRRVLVFCWGSDSQKYIGRSMTLYRDPDVTFGSMAVGGIRISHMSHINGVQEFPLTAKKGSKKMYVVKPLQTSAPAQPQEDLPPLTGEEFLALQTEIKDSKTTDDLKEVGLKVSAAGPRMTENQKTTLNKNYKDRMTELKGETNA